MEISSILKTTKLGLDLYFHRVKRKEIGYFRKVNFLVAFFEKRGYDRHDYSDWQVQLDDAQDLLRICNEVLEDHSKAEELLPTTGGFFFGNTDYDEVYFDDVREVAEFCESTLIPQLENLDEDSTIEFYASW